MNEGYTKVFVSLDGTEQQDFVLARAIKVAANNGAKLIIGHVIDSTALESAGSYPVDLVNGLEEAFKNSIAKQLEEAKANPDIPEVEVMIRAGRIRETLKDEMLDVVKPDLVLCGARGLSSINAKSLSEAARTSNLSYFNRPFIKEANNQICFVDIIVSVVAHLGKIRDANRIFQLSHVLLPSKKTHYCKCNIMCKSAQVPRIIEAVIMLRSIWLPYSSLRTFPHG